MACAVLEGGTELGLPFQQNSADDLLERNGGQVPEVFVVRSDLCSY